MTTDTNETWANNPSADPTSYPGNPVPGSCVLTHDRLLPMAVKVSGWLVEVEDEYVGIDEALRQLGVEGMQARQPVLAIGSNASAGQLRHKWSSDPDMVVPMTAVSVTSIGIGHSPHVSKAGYIPYVPNASTGTYSYFALWLTDAQVEDLNRTEPNYFPTMLRGSDYPVRLESRQELEEYLIYRGRWGVLADGEGIAIPAGTQDQALSVLNGLGDEVFTHEGLAVSPEARERARALLQERSVKDGLIWSGETPGQTIDAGPPKRSDTGGRITNGMITRTMPKRP